MPKAVVSPTPERLAKGDVIQNNGHYHTKKQHSIERWLSRNAITDEQASYAYRFAYLHNAQQGRWMPKVRWLGEPAGRDVMGFDQMTRLCAADLYTRCIMQMSNRSHALLVAWAVDEKTRDELCAVIHCSASSIRQELAAALDEFAKALNAVRKSEEAEKHKEQQPAKNIVTILLDAILKK